MKQIASEKLWNYMSLLSGAGIVLALYLLYGTLAPDPIKVCNVNAWINCEPVTTGSLAYLFGIPVALYGLIGYIVILYASLIRNKKLALGMTAFGLVFCLRLFILEIFVEKVLCPVCLMCQAIMIAVFAMGIILYRRKEPSALQTLTEAVKHIFRKK